MNDIASFRQEAIAFAVKFCFLGSLSTNCDYILFQFLERCNSDSDLFGFFVNLKYKSDCFMNTFLK